MVGADLLQILSSGVVRMDHRAFSPRLRILSIVPRWSLLPTTRPDTTSSHSFYVTLYARQIAKLIEWPGPMEELLWAALMHDQDEMITGDIVGFVKRAVVDPYKLEQFVNDGISNHSPFTVPTVTSSDEVNKIIRVADLMDAMFFICWETLQGNKMMGSRFDIALAALRDAWFNLEEIGILGQSWNGVILKAIGHHMNAESYAL